MPNYLTVPCPRCNGRMRREGKIFKCNSCGYETTGSQLLADAMARVIKKKKD